MNDVIEVIKATKLGRIYRDGNYTMRGISTFVLEVKTGELEIFKHYDPKPHIRPGTVVGTGEAFYALKQLIRQRCHNLVWSLDKNKIRADTQSFEAKFDVFVVPPLKPNPARERRYRFLDAIQPAPDGTAPDYVPSIHAKRWQINRHDELQKRLEAQRRGVFSGRYPGFVVRFYVPHGMKYNGYILRPERYENLGDGLEPRVTNFGGV